MNESHKNANRFSGFAEIYHNSRPACPPYVTGILPRYLGPVNNQDLGRRPHTVIDLGCGTGLSTMVWQGKADHIIGVEPSADMLAAARENLPNIAFVQAFSDNTGLADGIADIITCSQSFHWMEPVSTLNEIARLLKPGGVFAAFDCDWPPLCCSAAAERANDALFDKYRAIEANNEEFRRAFVQYPKDQHIKNMQASRHFQLVKEIVFANTEQSDADRYFAVAAMSQGGIQAVLKKDPTLLEPELSTFRAAVDRHFGKQTLPIEFCYRMRLGVRL